MQVAKVSEGKHGLISTNRGGFLYITNGYNTALNPENPLIL